MTVKPMRPATAHVTFGYSVKANCEEVFIKPGEFVTVWANGVQIEIRVLRDDTLEIFADKPVEVKLFKEWCPG